MNFSFSRVKSTSLALPLLAVLAGLLLRLAIEIWTGPGLPTYVTFYPVVMLVALSAGFWPGIATTLTAALVADYFLLGKQHQFGVETPVEAVGLIIFASMGILMSVVAGLYRRLRRDLESLVERRTRELREANDTLEQRAKLMDHSRDAFVVREMNGVIRFWNRGAALLYGWPAEEALGQSIHVMLHTEGLPPNHEANLAQAGHWQGELIHTTRDGRRVTVESSKTAMRDANGRFLVLESNRDITERKKAEEEIRRVNRNLEQFAYVASHDLQEPLRIMSSYSQLLERRYKGRLDKDADDFIAYIVEAAAQMQKLITDLLAYSRAGHRGGSVTEVDCNQVVSKVEAGLGVTIQAAGGSITRESLPVIRANQAAMIQLFQNLIANALKFRDEKPPRIHVSARKDEKEWVFSVRDNGIGIEEQYFSRIFDIFQRLHTREKYAGTGVGLSICKKIVEDMGGRIWVESEVGKGSTFYFTVPTAGPVG